MRKMFSEKQIRDLAGLKEPDYLNFEPIKIKRQKGQDSIHIDFENGRFYEIDNLDFETPFIVYSPKILASLSGEALGFNNLTGYVAAPNQRYFGVTANWYMYMFFLNGVCISLSIEL